MPATRTITLIPGDGIGPEVTRAVVRILEASGFTPEWESFSAGAEAVKEHGTTLPQPLLDSIAKNKIALKGPITTPIGKGFHQRQRRRCARRSISTPTCARSGICRRSVAFQRRRPGDRPREHRGSLRRPRAHGRARRRREPQDHHRQGVDADRRVCVRARAPPWPQESHGGPQGQHHEALRRPLPRLRARSPRRYPDIEYDELIVDAAVHAPGDAS